MRTLANELDLLKIKNTGNMVITKQNGRRKIIDCKHIDLKDVKSFKYTNFTGLSNISYGLILSEEETLYVYYTPYNNGYSRKYALHTDTNCHAITISPLQMLWRIKCGLVSMNSLKELAKINKIKGRSKLKTQKDYI